MGCHGLPPTGICVHGPATAAAGTEGSLPAHRPISLGFVLAEGILVSNKLFFCQLRWVTLGEFLSSLSMLLQGVPEVQLIGGTGAACRASELSSLCRDTFKSAANLILCKILWVGITHMQLCEPGTSQGWESQPSSRQGLTLLRLSMGCG